MRGGMSHRNVVVILFVCLLAVPAALSGDKKDKVKPEDLLARARSEEILRTKGTPSFVMRVQLQVANGKGGSVNGEYDLFWATPSQWREEVKFANYYRLRIGTAGGYWQASSLDYQPEVVFELDNLLDMRHVLSTWPNENLGKLRNRKRDGESTDCVEVRSKFGRVRTLCFDPSNDVLLNVEYPKMVPGDTGGISEIQYSSFKAVEGKEAPFDIRGLRGHKPELSVIVTKLEPMPEHDSGLFEPSANSKFWPTCDDVTAVQVIRNPGPRFDRMGSTETVLLYLVVEKDGSTSHIAVIRGDDRELDRAAIEAVRRWRFKPAMCGNTPVRVESELAFSVGQ